MAKQHERLRTPEGWSGQSRALIQQLERIHDDIYLLIGKLEEEIKEIKESQEEE